MASRRLWKIDWKGEVELKRKIRERYTLAIIFLILFAVLTVLVQRVDVQPVGPNGSEIGFAKVNTAVHEKLGENDLCYKLTKLIGYLAIATAPCFALLALTQAIRKRSLSGVDGDLWALAVFYVLVGACYIAFEKYVVNYRPILVDGVLEASYPSSHTMLTTALFGMTIVQMRKRVHIKPLRGLIDIVLGVGIAAMAVGRLMSGVHWLTDIAGGLLLGLALTELYDAVFTQIRRAQKRKAKSAKKNRK